MALLSIRKPARGSCALPKAPSISEGRVVPTRSGPHTAGMPLFLQRSRLNESAPPHGMDRVRPAGGGQPLDTAIRADLEPHFGRDLSEVRVHTDRAAADSARALSARAYTVGRDIVFGSGQYAPGTAAGKRLLGHELTHVVQQAAGPVSGKAIAPGLAVSEPADRFERAADHVADRVAAQPAKGTPLAPAPARSAASPAASGAVTVQRQAETDTPHTTLRPPPLLARSMGSATLDGFALDSATLTAEHRAQLTGLAGTILSLLDSYPGGRLNVVGYTDGTGSEAHNEVLGGQRAEAVLAALVAAHVPADIISTESGGAGAPVVPTKGPEPRNRRVVITFEPQSALRLVPSLTLDPALTAPPPPSPPPGPRFDPRSLLTLPPSYTTLHEETPAEMGRRILQPIPAIPRRSTSLSQAFFDRLDDSLNSVMRRIGIPASVRGLVRDGAHAAVSQGAESLLNAAMDAAGIHGDAERDAIRSAVSAAVQTPVQ